MQIIINVCASYQYGEVIGRHGGSVSTSSSQRDDPSRSQCGVEWCHVMSCLLAVLKEIIRHEASGSAERLSGGSRVLVEALVTVLEEGASGSTESLWSVMEQMAVRGALEGVRGVLEL